MDSQGIATNEAAENGDFAAAIPEQRTVDALFSATYEELRRLAATVRRGDQNATLSPTTLVNEAWLKLGGSRPVTVMSELHFKRLAARAMRQVLVEAARRRNALRRGGDSLVVTFDDGLDRTDAGADELLALDQALSDLARIQPRQAMMVETRFFAGLDVAETARLLQVSEATVLRDWRAARAWLARELRAS
jgi:RNA polymerase sigma factor (TIGR02999 family)